MMKPITLLTNSRTVLRTMLLLVSALMLALITTTTFAATPPVNSSDGDYAIHGYDPVAYFTDSRPRPGSKQFQSQYNGATWLFVNAANRDAFRADPKAYAPQYGGYCAYGVSKGYAPDIDPDAWNIVDDKLYLNYNLSVKRRWEKDISGYIKTANKKWPGVLK